MKKKKLLLCIPVLALMCLSSCSSSRSFIPQASNMVKSVSLEELNLTGKDYTILDRVEATARINVEITKSTYTVSDPDGAFKLSFEKNKKTGEMELSSFSGVVRAGYLLSRDNGRINLDSPDEIAHRMATYRLINLVREQGADGIIEPVVSTNIEQTKSSFGTTSVTFLTTVSGKPIRLKTTK